MKGAEPTVFQQLVYEAVSRIPAGRVATYKLIAGAIRCGIARAVGQALRSNPFAPKVPCHRVIRSDLTIGGYAGETEGDTLQKKIDLLEAEGVRFENGRLPDSRMVLGELASDMIHTKV